MSRPGGP
jgi:hypothetical protein